MAAYFNIFLIVMALLALAVYIALHYFEAGYGYLFNRKYGFPIPNRIGWVLMECPVFIAMTVLWLLSDRTWEAAPLALLILFQGHYLQRAFIFPLLIRGNSKMPAGIVGMGMLFNTLNALMQGGWIFSLFGLFAVGTIGSIVTSVVGAIVLLWIVAAVGNKKEKKID